MLSFHLTSLLLLTVVGRGFAAPPPKSTSSSPDSLSNHPEDEGPGHLSLPNLFDLKDISDLGLTWAVSGSPRLETGRVIFDSASGAAGLWSIASLENSATEWSIEYVFRSSGNEKIDTQYSKNGLAFWLINQGGSDSLSGENYGGPSRYDGFQLLVSNGETNGLKVFSGDGLTEIKTDIASSIGNCAFNYLDSQVPTTVRVSFSRASNWFKVQVDNNLCFKTDRIEIPLDSPDFKFGVTANVEQGSAEVFELFKVQVWPHLIGDAVDDHGLLSDGHVKIEFTTVSTEVKPTSYVKPGVIRESLMAKTQKQRQEIMRQMQDEADQNSQQTSDDSRNVQLPDLSKIESQVKKIDLLIDNLDNPVIAADIARIVEAQLEQKQTLAELQKSVSEFESTISQQYSQLLNAVAKLNEKVIGEVREQQYGVDAVAKKVDLLMSNHKEIQYKYEQQTQSIGETGTDVAQILASLTRWILIPIIIGIIVLTFIVSRLRHDIKHSKLL